MSVGSVEREILKDIIVVCVFSLVGIINDI